MKSEKEFSKVYYRQYTHVMFNVTCDHTQWLEAKLPLCTACNWYTAYHSTCTSQVTHHSPKSPLQSLSSYSNSLLLANIRMKRMTEKKKKFINCYKRSITQWCWIVVLGHYKAKLQWWVCTSQVVCQVMCQCLSHAYSTKQLKYFYSPLDGMLVHHKGNTPY